MTHARIGKFSQACTTTIMKPHPSQYKSEKFFSASKRSDD